MSRLIATLVVCGVVGAPLMGQVLSFGPAAELRPAETLIATLSVGAVPEDVATAARRAASSLGMTAHEEGGSLLVALAKMTPEALDQSCEYPVINGKTGRELDTYKSLQRRLLKLPGSRQLVRGSWSLALSGSAGEYRLASRCLVQAGRYAPSSGEPLGLQAVVASSTGQQEQRFYEALAAQLKLAPTQIVRQLAPPRQVFHEECPLTQEISKFPPLGSKLSVKGEAGSHCRGLAIRRIDVWTRRGIWSPVERRVVPGEGAVLVLETRVSVPPGEDQELRIHAELSSGGQLLGSGTEEVEGEADDVNWGDGITIPIPAGIALETLRVTVETKT